MKSPRLSICIATYNRAQFIGATLESIVPQLNDDVEIVIADGASTDNTSEVVKKFEDSCKHIRYIRLPSKGGVDHDYCKAVEYAWGEMCWLFSDDDLLKTNAISTILNEINKKPSLIVVNAQAMNSDLSKVIENKRFPLEKNKIYLPTEMEQFFGHVVEYMSFIGCIVINRELWLEREKTSYFNTEFIHIGVIFQETLPGPVLIIAEPLVMIRVGNFQWTTRAFEIWMCKWPNLLYSFQNLSEPVRKKYKQSPSWSLLKSIILNRAYGSYSIIEYNKWFLSKKARYGWKTAVFFIAIIPACLLNLLMIIYFQFIKKTEPVKLYMLKNSSANIICRIRTSFINLLNRRA